MTAVHRWVGDLVLVAFATFAATGAVFVLGLGGPLRIALLLPMMLFIPGYALVAVLFPERRSSSRALRSLDRARVIGPRGREYFQIGTAERLVLSVALTLAIIPLALFGLNFSPFALLAEPLLLVLTGFTLICLALAGLRRAFVDPKDRYDAFDELGVSTEGVFGGGGVYSLALVGSLLVLAATGAYAGVAPVDSDPFTEYYLVTENDGEFTSENVNGTIRDGGTVHVAIGNQEGEDLTYTTVVQLETVGDNGDVSQAEELDRFSTDVNAGETKRVPYNVSASSDGERTRIAFLLFEGEPDGEADRDAAYRTTHVWLSPPEDRA
ncbi:DUF1616 domain-containing protein [Halegenticoccus tardaugens]|uniref:DUF1616 domain-containing protein n=1 Tax=Halegenticoccus tardaugens TaxID=2071624 RepID=UPI00100A55DA|nr:DUF1616 domain-containing protein [Halegenticoccus tardaugens]